MIAILLLAAAPTLAACVAQAQRGAETLAPAMLAQVLDGRSLNAADRTRLDRLRADGEACGRRQRLTAARAEATGRWTIADLAARAFRERLRTEGIELLAVDRRLRATAPAVLDAFIAKDVANARVVTLGAELIGSAGGPRLSAEQRRLLGAYSINEARRLREPLG